mgnify:CR=1 FL=1
MIAEIPSSDLNQKAFKTLFETLGYSDTIRFLRQYRDGSGDSIAQKDANFQNQSVDEIYNAIKAKSN